jgi:predicted lysophospholipase L1 biosynthesis ABC-type transport system permease subunit
MLHAIGRLKQNVAFEHAVSELDSIRQGAAIEGADDWKKLFNSRKIYLTDQHGKLAKNTCRLLFILLGAVGLILSLGCANVANPILSRAVGKRKQVAIQAALGASRSRLIRLALVESGLLAMGGGAAGLAIGAWLTKALVAWGGPNIFGDLSHLAVIQLDVRVLAFTLGIALITVVIWHRARDSVLERRPGGSPARRQGNINLRRLPPEPMGTKRWSRCAMSSAGR